MEIEIWMMDVALSLMLFLALNWVGRHSAGSGYITLSAFLQHDEAPAFNLLFRVVGPLVFVTLAASTLYALDLDNLVKNIWVVVALYYLWRMLYVIFMERTALMNWRREIFLWVASIGLSWVLYERIISDRDSLLPDLKDLKNQFWILLILFLYATMNRTQYGFDGTVRRKKEYLRRLYAESRSKFGSVVSNIATDKLSESLVYAVLMYEQFNRPAPFRWAEHLTFPWLSRSLGPMQVTTKKRLSNIESVRLGSEHVVEIYQEAYVEGRKRAAAKDGEFNPLKNSSHRRFIVYKISSIYNKDDDYVSGISEMHDQVIDLFFDELKFRQEHWTEYLF